MNHIRRFLVLAFVVVALAGADMADLIPLSSATGARYVQERERLLKHWSATLAAIPSATASEIKDDYRLASLWFELRFPQSFNDHRAELQKISDDYSQYYSEGYSLKDVVDSYNYFFQVGGNAWRNIWFPLHAIPKKQMKEWEEAERDGRFVGSGDPRLTLFQYLDMHHVSSHPDSANAAATFRVIGGFAIASEYAPPWKEIANNYNDLGKGYGPEYRRSYPPPFDAETEAQVLAMMRDYVRQMPQHEEPAIAVGLMMGMSQAIRDTSRLTAFATDRSLSPTIRQLAAIVRGIQTPLYRGDKRWDPAWFVAHVKALPDDERKAFFAFLSPTWSRMSWNTSRRHLIDVSCNVSLGYHPQVYDEIIRLAFDSEYPESVRDRTELGIGTLQVADCMNEHRAKQQHQLLDRLRTTTRDLAAGSASQAAAVAAVNASSMWLFDCPPKSELMRALKELRAERLGPSDAIDHAIAVVGKRSSEKPGVAELQRAFDVLADHAPFRFAVTSATSPAGSVPTGSATASRLSR